MLRKQWSNIWTNFFFSIWILCTFSYDTIHFYWSEFRYNEYQFKKILYIHLNRFQIYWKKNMQMMIKIFTMFTHAKTDGLCWCEGIQACVHMFTVRESLQSMMFKLVSWVLCHINPCRLFNAKSCLYIFMLNIYDLLMNSLYSFCIWVLMVLARTCYS